MVKSLLLMEIDMKDNLRMEICNNKIINITNNLKFI
jgi:hypothetical protein